MTFIPVNFDEAVEPKPVPKGRYDLQITECNVVKTGEKSKNPGRDQYKASIAILGHENAPNITQFISLPHEDDERSSANFKALLLKRFLVAFGVRFDSNGIDVEGTAMEMVGCTASNIEVDLSEPDDNGNVYNRIIVPKLRDEPTGRR